MYGGDTSDVHGRSQDEAEAWAAALADHAAAWVIDVAGRCVGSARTLGLHRVGLRVLAYNDRAIRCYKKCGFREEGRERQKQIALEDQIIGVENHVTLSAPRSVNEARNLLGPLHSVEDEGAVVLDHRDEIDLG